MSSLASTISDYQHESLYDESFYYFDKKTISKRHTISVDRDEYLNSHRFSSIPFFPFVMGMEYFCNIADIKEETIIFSNYQIIGPLMLRRDRDKDIVVSIEAQDSNYKFTIESDCVKHIVSSIQTRNDSRSFERCLFDIDHDTEVLKRLDKGIYVTALPHGPHFQNSFDIVDIDENLILARQFDFKNKLKYFDSKDMNELKLEPALLDGLLQLCAIHAIKYSETYILPQAVKSCYLNLKLIREIDSSIVMCKKKNEFCYDIFVGNDDGVIIAEFKDMTFSPLKRSTFPIL